MPLHHKLFFNFTQFIILETLQILDLALSGVKGSNFVLFVEIQEKPEYNEKPPAVILYQVALGLGYLELPQGMSLFCVFEVAETKEIEPVHSNEVSH